MPDTDIGNAIASDLTTTVTDFSVDTASLDKSHDQKETYYDNTNWTQQLGYYQKIPELTSAIDAKATWTVGKGFKADEVTTMILDAVKGWGKDTMNTILENMIRTMYIGGDAFAEIITDDEGFLINLKPLDPEVIRIVVNRQGLIIRYEQRNHVNKEVKKFIPTEIFHLARNRVGDEIHGVSAIDAVEEMILMRNEAMTDWKRVLHRNVDPLWIFHLDTDDTAKIAAFKTKNDTARGKGENMYIPKGAVVPELVTTAQNATLNPLPWIQMITGYFYQAIGVPDIILGSSTNLTEASAKIAYMAFEQTVREDQLFIEEQFLAQVNLVIKLEFPATLENEMLSSKDDPAQVNPPQVQPEQAAEPNDTTAEMEGRK